MKRILSIVLCLCIIATLSSSMLSCSKAKNPDGPMAYVLAQKGSAYSLGLAESFKVAFEEAGGNVTMETFPEGTEGFSEYFSKAIDVEADVIFLPDVISTAPALLKCAKEMGINVPILAGDTWESSIVLESVKDTGLDLYCITFFDESDTDEDAMTFVDGFKKFLNENSEYYEMNGSGDMVAAVSALGFDAYNVAMSAIRTAAEEKGEDLTSVDVARALWSTDHDGITGNISFDENGDALEKTVYIKKAAADGSAFEFVKKETVTSGCDKGSAPAYDKDGIAIDTDNKRITVGVYQPTTGDDAPGGNQELLGVIYANSLDNKVMIDGKEYEVVLNVSDNGSLVEYSLATSTKLVEEKSIVVIGSYGSGVSLGAVDTFEAAGLAAIGASCTGADITFGNDYYFRTTVVETREGSVMASFAMSLMEASSAKTE
ncbi:MAG: ABC transporter substrate-binding protein [Clostridia bacterium]|nr:ABC transporter substrate-binding protein [Clostridia bacterium]